MSNSLTLLADKLATRLGMAADGEVLDVLKSTAFKGDVNDAQMMALLIVANQYELSPWTKEIYAFPDKRGGIVPVVGVDGWARIINNHPQFDGMDFDVQPDAVTCTIYRKDRSHPTRVSEFLEECNRGTDPWKSHPRRMLRHKAMIQCARVAFGFTGIHDRDEAERIIESQVIDADTGEIINRAKAAPPGPPPLQPYSQESLDANLPKWREVIQSGRKTADQIIAMAETRATLTDAQRKVIRDLGVIEATTKAADVLDPADLPF